MIRKTTYTYETPKQTSANAICPSSSATGG
jgi:hypothetical protein